MLEWTTGDGIVSFPKLEYVTIRDAAHFGSLSFYHKYIIIHFICQIKCIQIQTILFYLVIFPCPSPENTNNGYQNAEVFNWQNKSITLTKRNNNL